VWGGSTNVVLRLWRVSFLQWSGLRRTVLRLRQPPVRLKQHWLRQGCCGTVAALLRAVATCCGPLRTVAPPTAIAIGVIDNVSVVHWFRLGRTRVHVGAPAVVPPPELLAKSHFCGPNLEARPDFESSRRGDSESGFRFPPRGMRNLRCFASRWRC
jgi:hypothetical protein